MQIMLRTLLAIYLGHLLTDFIFQTNRLVEQKRRGKPGAYLLHGWIHYFSVILLLGFLVPGSFLSLRAQLVIVGLTLAHLLIDFFKIQLSRKNLVSDGSWAYVSDQVVHFLTVVIAAGLISPAGSFSALASLLEKARGVQNQIIAVPVIYIAVVFGGGYLVRFLTKALAENAENNSREKSREQLQNAGLYIGWLERFLVLTALLLKSPAMVGLIFTAKSIARYPEFKSERFAEYFLIGTLLSLSIAILGAVLLLKLLPRQIGLPS